jgi:hypothetical protein
MRTLDSAYQTTVRVIAAWHKQMLFARPRTIMERVLIFTMPTLWAFALMVGAAAIFF